MTIRSCVLAGALALVAADAPAQGLFNADVIDVDVLPGWREEGMGHIAAIRFRLEPGWKTYWRAPGDAGIPPVFNWSSSRNVAAVTPHWPVPEIFVQNGMRSIGYAQEVIIPLHIARRDADAPIHLEADIQLGVCEEICIPAYISVTATLPPEGSADASIIAALADRPMTEAEARVSNVTCSVAPIEDGLALTVRATMPPLGRGEAAVIETADPAVWVAEPDVTREGNQLTAETQLISYEMAAMGLDRSGVRMTVFGGGQAVDIQGCTGG